MYAQRFLRKQHPDLTIEKVSDNSLFTIIRGCINRGERSCVAEQNLSILRRRVEELGVSEPVIQRQGAERIVVELPGCTRYRASERNLRCNS